MKQFKSMILVGLALLALTISVHAGNLAVAPQGQGGGNEQIDLTSKQRVQEVYHRGIHWSTPTAMVSAPASNLSLGVTLTGASTNYKGPYFFRIYNTTLVNLAVRPSNTNTAFTVAVGVVTAAGASSPHPPEPISRRHGYVQVIGNTATAASAPYYSIGWLE